MNSALVIIVFIWLIGLMFTVGSQLSAVTESLKASGLSRWLGIPTAVLVCFFIWPFLLGLDHADK